VQNINFPFSAFGLLIDNSMNNGATQLKITYNHYRGFKDLKVLKFEDDARLSWSD
jgi:hypothetical protein